MKAATWLETDVREKRGLFTGVSAESEEADCPGKQAWCAFDGVEGSLKEVRAEKQLAQFSINDSFYTGILFQIIYTRRSSKYN